MKTNGKAYPGPPAIKFTCIIPQSMGARLRHLIGELGITEMSTQHARRTLLHKRSLSEELAEIVKFRTHESCEERVIAALSGGCGFGEPGRGSIVSQRINLLGLDLPPCPAISPTPLKPGILLRRDLAGLSCIVPRGEGTTIARAVLNAGLGAPVVTYAEGVASRAKLGLIRVTIPAGKEIVSVFIGRHDIADAFRMVNDTLRINQPGAGFCYWFPVDVGILDTRIWIGHQPHVASMEQVIAALDVVTGDTAWRHKVERTSQQPADHPARLTSYTIYGPEIDTEAVVNAALAAGAGGATLSRVHRELQRSAGDIPSAYESSELIIPEAMLPRIHEAVIDAGLIEQRGYIEIAEVGEASGYRAP